jgi:hypothetical protein
MLPRAEQKHARSPPSRAFPFARDHGSRFRGNRPGHCRPRPRAAQLTAELTRGRRIQLSSSLPAGRRCPSQCAGCCGGAAGRRLEDRVGRSHVQSMDPDVITATRRPRTLSGSGPDRGRSALFRDRADVSTHAIGNNFGRRAPRHQTDMHLDGAHPLSR